MSVSQPAADGAVVVHGEDAETLGDAARAAVGLLADARDTGGAVSAVRVTLAGGADGARPHRHGRSAELFFVLGGRAQMLVGDAVVLALERVALGEATGEQLTAAQERFDTWFLESTAWTRARARPGTKPPQ